MDPEAPAQQDALINFLFDDLPVRGVLLQAGPAWQELESLHEYPEPVRDLLGESLAAATMIASTMKLAGMLTLQLQAGRGLGMLIAQCDAHLRFRGMAGATEGPVSAASDSFATLAGGGRLSLTVEATRRRDSYQGIVPVSGNSLGEALSHYYRDSAQLDAHFVFRGDGEAVGALMLQRMPDEQGMDSDDWHRLCLMADTLTLDELRPGVSIRLVHKLFAEDDVIAYAPRTTGFHCRCDAARAEQAVRLLGEDDALALLRERGGEIEVTCEFCNKRRTLDIVDVRRLFTGQLPTGSDDERVH